MVCAKCQKTEKTTLITPGVKKKSEMYYGSPAAASSSSSSASGPKKSATLGNTGVVKSKLLSKAAQNPYAQYSSTCTRCKAKVSEGHKFCTKCAYRANSCAICGKPNKTPAAGAPLVNGQKFTLK
ncbi:microtubule-associated protein CRIPT-domain-containing protein [Pseudoneurospora amorphoporcata]|uniref:Cysteine-rich PDZ-binding protein n=1 Tax=Pseudoneurospora amorphoporcata TaxID=241081 RepID=A0AAN6SGL2_9PEZI|nr:microtubule-associated protein CRIPT-domain-containing protein [Pseudoneurospora amorphoporcata]